MALTIAPQKGTGMPASTRGRKPEYTENPFLDETMDGNLLQSYESGDGEKTKRQDYVIQLSGTYEPYEAKDRQGNPAGTKWRYTGDAKDANTLLRRASDELNVGVRIVAELAKQPKVINAETGETDLSAAHYNFGSKANPQVRIMYVATERRKQNFADDNGPVSGDGTAE